MPGVKKEKTEEKPPKPAVAAKPAKPAVAAKPAKREAKPAKRATPKRGKNGQFLKRGK